MRTGVVIIFSALALSACGTTADPEQVDTLTTVLTSEKSPLGMPLPKDQASCLARVYLESDLSEKALDNLRAGKPLAPVTEDDTQVIQKISRKVADCM